VDFLTDIELFALRYELNRYV